MYQGSCLCGSVKFSISGPINDIIYCHCSLCRKAQGSAFATNANVNLQDFNFLSGETNLTAYKTSNHQTKMFCKSCGSPMLSKDTNNPNNIRIRLGTIDSDISERPGKHVFVASKANWEEITDDLPKFDEYN